MECALHVRRATFSHNYVHSKIILEIFNKQQQDQVFGNILKWLVRMSIF